MSGFDLQKTNEVHALLATARDRRDDAWRQAFFAAIIDAPLVTPSEKSEQVVRGPDGFPYFVLSRPPVARQLTPLSVSQLLGHCTGSGLGIVIEPTNDSAEWVFTYGDLFSLRAYGSFEGDPIDRESDAGPKVETVKAGHEFLIGAPSEEFLPSWARRVIAQFLKSAAKIENPGVCVMADPARAPSRNLVFNIHPENFPSHEDFELVMNAISWFLPAKRACVAMSRKTLAASDFIPL
jgi:hypothetical protein